MVTEHTVRRATENDVEAIQRVARESWEAAYDEFVDAAVIEETLSTGYSREFLREAIASPDLVLFVGEADGEVAGYVSCEPPDANGIGQVSIYVDPEYWGEGLGTRLLERATEYLRSEGATAIRDTVLAENEVGNAFYRTHFERIGGTTVEMGGKEYDAYVYEGEL